MILHQSRQRHYASRGFDKGADESIRIYSGTANAGNGDGQAKGFQP